MDEEVAVTGESIPVGWIVSKTKWIKVSEIHSGSMALSFQTLRSDFCQAAIQSDIQKETVGHREEGVRRSTQRGKEKATAVFTGQYSQHMSGLREATGEEWKLFYLYLGKYACIQIT